MRYQITSLELIKQMLAETSDDIALPWSAYPCLLWPRGQNGEGYGRVHIPQLGKDRSVTRVAYEIANNCTLSTIQKVCHYCDNPPCFRQSHLFIGSDGDNARDSAIKGRRFHPAGYLNPKAKLTDEQVAEIIHLRKQGWKLIPLAAKFSVGHLAISRICRGVTWRHV